MKWLLAALVLVVIAAGLELSSTGTVTGSVKGIPCLRLPPEQCQKPMEAVEVRFEPELAGASVSVLTAGDGSFNVRLRPGKYRIQVQSTQGTAILDGPTQVTVLPFTTTRAEFLIPSGLR